MGGGLKMMQADSGGKKALLFGKRSKNFCSLGARVGSSARANRQKFFGSFFKKELLAF